MNKQKIKKTRWIFSTVIIGLLPFILRLSIYLVSEKSDINFLMAGSDFAILGLVLNLTNINEIEHKVGDHWKSLIIGVSIVLIAFCAGFLALSYVSDLPGQNLIRREVIFYIALGLGAVSLIFSYSVYNMIQKLSYNE